MLVELAVELGFHPIDLAVELGFEPVDPADEFGPDAIGLAIEAIDLAVEFRLRTIDATGEVGVDAIDLVVEFRLRAIDASGEVGLDMIDLAIEAIDPADQIRVDAIDLAIEGDHVRAGRQVVARLLGPRFGKGLRLLVGEAGPLQPVRESEGVDHPQPPCGDSLAIATPDGHALRERDQTPAGAGCRVSARAGPGATRIRWTSAAVSPSSTNRLAGRRSSARRRAR